MRSYYYSKQATEGESKICNQITKKRMLYVLGQSKRQNYVHDVAINTIPLQYFPNNHHNKQQDHVVDFELRT